MVGYEKKVNQIIKCSNQIISENKPYNLIEKKVQQLLEKDWKPPQSVGSPKKERRMRSFQPAQWLSLVLRVRLAGGVERERRRGVF